MESKVKYVPQHLSGHLITIRCERASRLDTAARFDTAEDVERFLYGMYGPDKPDEYRAVPLKITFELEEIDDDRTTEEPVSEDQPGDAGRSVSVQG